MGTKLKNEEYNAPRLCGGTFFTLLLRATKQGLNGRKSFGVRSNFTEGDVLEGLIKVACPTYQRPADKANFSSAVSPYKSCNTSKSGRLPITDQATISAFDNRVKADYQTALSNMSSLVDTYLDVDAKGVWLGRALLELIANDASIQAHDEFYINQDGSKSAKKYLSGLLNICLPAFLLGIWHFIVVNKIDNSIGKYTYDSWHIQGAPKNAKKTFVSKIGESIMRKITLIPFLNNPAEDVEADIISDTQEDYSANQDNASATDSNATNQSIHTAELKYQQNSLVVNMGGSHNSIGNIIMSQTIIKGKEEA